MQISECAAKKTADNEVHLYAISFISRYNIPFGLTETTFLRISTANLKCLKQEGATYGPRATSGPRWVIFLFRKEPF
jgi:hypothetical protein